MSRDVLEVVEPGILATIQDDGRPGLETMGVTPGGVADRLALAVANALLGNAPGAAGVELTFSGAVLRALRPITLAVAGADLGARRRASGGAEGRTIPPGATVALGAGEELAFSGTQPDIGQRGCRACLAVPGGIDVPVVLGSRATALAGGFGGVDGRPLRGGDRLAAMDPARDVPPATWPGPPGADPGRPLRILPGPHAPGPADPALRALAGGAWTVARASDRVGLRLDGAPLPGASTGDLPSHGVVTGSVQGPPDGTPIILGVEHQPTGGYPVIAVVIDADCDALGQLAPGDPVSFELVDVAQARAALAQARAQFRAAAATLAEDRGWDDLWRGAGA
jgi:biotin-dependent carboxylase-like uncharacterized protein